jgi:hypothetical protein
MFKMWSTNGRLRFFGDIGTLPYFELVTNPPLLIKTMWSISVEGVAKPLKKKLI